MSERYIDYPLGVAPNGSEIFGPVRQNGRDVTLTLSQMLGPVPALPLTGGHINGTLLIDAGGATGNVNIQPHSYYDTSDTQPQFQSYMLNAWSGPGGPATHVSVFTDIAAEPTNGFWTSINRLNYSPGSPTAGSNATHVAGYFQTLRSAYAPGVGNPSLECATFEMRDTTGHSTSVTRGGTVSAEFDIFANGPDNYGSSDTSGSYNGFYIGQGSREILSLDIGRSDSSASGAPMEVSTCIGIYGGATMMHAIPGNSASAMVPEASFKQVIYVSAPFSVSAFDTRSATQLPGANAIALGTGHNIALDNAGPAGAPKTLISSDGTMVTLTGAQKVTAGLAAFGVAPPASRPTISGSRGSATVAVLTALLTALNATGLINDATTA